jgi:Nucleoside-diphosphate-sugar pyrophosphorylase involved in lipopolysaccharide biosynthesis/translation initiation factor 2B, gamma/epsilon subunits (eIF-2Bgamma/eIF-2Bepsilon)
LKIARTATVDPTAPACPGFQAIGERCFVEAGAVIEDSILWDDATIRNDAILQGCVVAGSLVISGRHKDADLVEVV